MMDIRRSGFARLCRLAVLGLAVVTVPTAAHAQGPVPAAEQADGRYAFVTLGTQGGPIPNPERSQPANLLVRRGHAHLVDAGDGAASRMAAAGAPLPWLRSIFISHIHFDHIGGLYAVLGLRHQIGVHTPLTIYGPPGTRAIVEGLQAAMAPTSESGFGVPGERAVAPSTAITIVELTGGMTVALPDFTVKTAENSHYSFAPGGGLSDRYKSLSYRFELPDRSIVYTGDTGPSDAVVELARGADLLVTEMIDLDAVTAQMRRTVTGQSPDAIERLAQHLAAHHLTTHDAAALANRARVSKVVITHLAGSGSAEALPRYLREVGAGFAGPVVIASDLARY